jgi:hypothetical protein
MCAERKMRKWIGVALLVCSVGCTAHYPGSPTPAPTVAAVRIHYGGSHQWVNPGNSLLLTLYAINSDGVYEVVTSRAQWFSTNSSIATVTNGTARGVAGGSADIVASYQGYTSSARIVVLEPNSVRYPWLDVRSFPVPETGKTSRATVMLFQTPSSGRDVSTEATWSSSDPNVFSMTGSTITAQGPGTASIVATFNGLTATSYASVQPIRALP